MENLYEPFSISFETLDQYPKREQKKSFFELVYILSGNGIQCVNNNTFNYKVGNMFLHTPNDCHSISIETRTQFFFLRFNNEFIQSCKFKNHTIQYLDLILTNAKNQPGCILKNQTDKSLICPLIDAIIREKVNGDLYNQEIIEQLVTTILVIVARNIAKYLPVSIATLTDVKSQEILHYIQSNIYNPSKLKATTIAEKFNISENYLGKYFKKQTNETMQQYITNYKLRLIETRLQRSKMRISEIANEFNFSDESHLNKFFKKQKGISPKKYRIHKPA